MNKLFSYSILRYTHSQLLGESLNVGVLFAFEGEQDLHFFIGDLQRLRTVYPDFDSGYVQLAAKGISAKLKDIKIEPLFLSDYNLKEQLTKVLLPEDSTALQFSDIFEAVNGFGSVDAAIEAFTRVLLPELSVRKEESRHNESFILNRYTELIIEKNIRIEHRMRRNHPIQIKGVKLNFELSWKNGIVHLIKPLSFDLREGQDILNKSAQYVGYLNLLSDYAQLNQFNFDLLIGKPQDRHLLGSYEDALYNLERSLAPKSLITEEKLEEYSEETVRELEKKGL